MPGCLRRLGHVRIASGLLWRKSSRGWRLLLCDGVNIRLVCVYHASASSFCLVLPLHIRNAEVLRMDRKADRLSSEHLKSVRSREVLWVVCALAAIITSSGADLCPRRTCIENYRAAYLQRSAWNSRFGPLLRCRWALNFEGFSTVLTCASTVAIIVKTELKRT